MRNSNKRRNAENLKNQFENAVIIAALLFIFFLLFGIAGGLEQGTLNFPWEVK